MDFCKKVEKLTGSIPKGKVASYGQIAVMVSNIRAARAVGWCLHGLDSKPNFPWHRVLNSKGFITTTCEDHNANMQKQMLEKEGVTVIKKKGMWWVDLDKYLWIP
jgi:methylated-DNA-protein-cysteine methyltransferase-like protein